MRGGNTYSHRSFLDVVMYVVKIQYAGIDHIKAKVKWYNKGGLFLGDDKVVVKREHMKNWKWVGNG